MFKQLGHITVTTCTITTFQDFCKYWPDVNKTYDKIIVQPKSEEEKDGFVIRKFTVTGEQVITVSN